MKKITFPTLLIIVMFFVFIIFIGMLISFIVNYKKNTLNINLEQSEYITIEEYSNNENFSYNYLSRFIDIKNRSVCYQTAVGKISCLNLNNQFTKENIKTFQFKNTKYKKGIEMFKDIQFNILCYQTASSQLSCVQKKVETVH